MLTRAAPAPVGYAAPSSKFGDGVFNPLLHRRGQFLLVGHLHQLFVQTLLHFRPEHEPDHEPPPQAGCSGGGVEGKEAPRAALLVNGSWRNLLRGDAPHTEVAGQKQRNSRKELATLTWDVKVFQPAVDVIPK